MNEALSIDNLTKKYKNKIALDDFSMKIMPGEIVEYSCAVGSSAIIRFNHFSIIRYIV